MKSKASSDGRHSSKFQGWCSKRPGDPLPPILMAHELGIPISTNWLRDLEHGHGGGTDNAE